MTNKVDWFFKILRVSSAWNPIAAVFLQMQSEIDGAEMNRRLDSLEDPISSNCENSSDLCRALYADIKGSKDSFPQKYYIHFSRPLAFFESEGYLKRKMQVGTPYAYGIEYFEPTFVLYLARLFECQTSMLELYTRIEECDIGVWIDGIQLSETLNIPETVVRSVFTLYMDKGFGILSKEIGTCNYQGIA